MVQLYVYILVVGESVYHIFFVHATCHSVGDVSLIGDPCRRPEFCVIQSDQTCTWRTQLSIQSTEVEIGATRKYTTIQKGTAKS